MMFMGDDGWAPMANPLTGAPGAVLLYALIGAMVWPNGRPGGLFGVARRTSRVGGPVAGDGVAVAGRGDGGGERDDRRDQRGAHRE